jgi:pimeloyl-ACP methyl ester carboxylesterase
MPDIAAVPLYQTLCGNLCVQTTSLLWAPLRCPTYTFGTGDLLGTVRQRIALSDEYTRLVLAANLSVPLVVVTGAFDRVAPVAHFQEAWATGTIAAPSLHLTILPEAGHYPRYEAPDAFASAVGAAFA